MKRKRRLSDDERAVAAARLFYRDGLSDDAIRRTATYENLMKWKKTERARRKQLKEERADMKSKATAMLQ